MITKTIHASISRKRISSSFACGQYQKSSLHNANNHSTNRRENSAIPSRPTNKNPFYTASSYATIPIRSFHSSYSTYLSQNKTNHAIKNTKLQIDGEYCYQKVLDAIDAQKQKEEEREQQQAMEQYEAMERVSEKSKKRQTKNKNSKRRTRLTQQLSKETQSNPKNNRAAGVAVIRTITRQARKKRNEEDDGMEVLNDPMEAIQITKTSSKDINTTVNDFSSQLDIDWKEEEQKWLEKAAYEFLHPKALVRLGNQMIQETSSTKGVGSLPDNFMDMDQMIDAISLNHTFDEQNMNSAQKAAYLYKIAGQQSSSEGWFNLGHLLWTGFPEQNDNIDQNGESQLLEMDTQSSLEAFEKAIELGDADAMYFVGVQLLLLPESPTITNNKSAIVEKDQDAMDAFPPPPSSKMSLNKQRGLTLIQKAAKDHHHGGAMHYLALLYLNGDSTLHIDPCTPAQFQTLLDQACDLGHNSDALYLRAHSYYHGNTFSFFPSIYPRHTSKALTGFELAATYGSSDGAVSAGVMWYEQGEHDKAFEWYQKAAEMGNKEGWRNVVRCYALGEGVMRSESTAKYIAKLMLNDADDEDSAQ